MELFLDIVFFGAWIIAIIMNLFYQWKTYKNTKKIRLDQIDLITSFNGRMISLNDQIGDIAAILENYKKEHDRSMLELRTLLTPATPIKPNNWNSMKEVFTRPTRVDPNE